MKLLIVYIVLAFCGLAYASALKDIQQEWLEYLNKYGKNYRSWDENQKRFENFVNNYKLIKQHNEHFEKGLVSYKMAVNPFSDMSLKEMKVSYMGLNLTENDKQQFRNLKQFEALKAPTYNNIPSTKDWRKTGCITAVKDQKSCGSCWAFASTGALEAHYCLKFKKKVIISEQNLIDCSTKNSGCNGGSMIPSFEYIRDNKGINPEDKYPYEAVQGKCRYQSRYIAATCSGYRTIPQGNEQALSQAVASKGPIAVAIAVNSNFMHYKGGIYDDATCSKAVNHAVLLVGYGSEKGVDYWLVKNSWGSSWGEKGYIKMRRNKQNQCAIANYGSYPVV
ncbi:hypothetical protein DOY81_003787 [Sarcophaga bullata]|nr:hypothetical protein DOY81_003787 [Sarcophaga bullata]